MDDKFFTDTQIGAIIALSLISYIAWQNAIFSIIFCVLFALVVFLYDRGWFHVFIMWIHPKIKTLAAWAFSKIKPVQLKTLAPYEIILGVDPITGENDIESLETLVHMGVYGTTRYGKTTWLHSIIHQLIRRHTVQELKLCISDPKTVDYPFYGRLPHLLCPIAQDEDQTSIMVDIVIVEMEHRKRLFKPYAENHVCNNLTRYANLSGDKLPHIVVIFDELADVVTSGSNLEKNIIRLAKIGGGFGIHLICATQRPSAKVVTGEIKSQMSSKISTWMASNREYGTVAEISENMYSNMPQIPGRFMVYTAKGWRFIQGNKIPDKELAALARKLAGKRHMWPAKDNNNQQKQWSGSDRDKIKLIRQLAEDLERTPKLDEIMARFGVSKPTASKFRNMAKVK